MSNSNAFICENRIQNKLSDVCITSLLASILKLIFKVSKSVQCALFYRMAYERFKSILNLCLAHLDLIFILRDHR